MHSDVEKLVAAGRLNSAAGNLISSLEPKTYCTHKSWGAGRVKSWELLDDRIIIDFHGKPGHSMKLEFAAKSVTPVGEDHIHAKLMADPEGTVEMATKDPVSFVRTVLASHDSRMFLDTFDDLVKGTFIDEAKYKSWWESAKKKLRQDKSFVVPSKRTEPMELRAADLSPSAAMIADFENVRDLKSKAKALGAIHKDIGLFENPETDLDSVIKQTNEGIARGTKLHLAPALELITVRDELQKAYPKLKPEEQPTVAEILRSEKDRLPSILPKLQVAAQRPVYASFKDAFGDEWANEMFNLLKGAGARGIMEVTKILVAEGKTDDIIAFLKHGLQQRNLSQDLLAWMCKERTGVTEPTFGPDLGNAVMNAIEKEHYDDETPTNNRLRDVLIADTELLPDLVRDADKGYVKTITRRVMGTPVFEELSKRSLLARIVKIHPDMEKVVSGEEDGTDTIETESLVVSWESLEARKLQLDEIINVKIPQNKKEIQVAREHGDLRENFEYKAAKQQAAVLNRQRTEYEAELKKARATDFAGSDTNQVSIGTIVEIKDSENGSIDTYTILGAWDTDLDKGIISYLSETAKALIGTPVGSEVEVPTEKAGVGRKVEVTSITAFNTAPATA